MTKRTQFYIACKKSAARGEIWKFMTLLPLQGYLVAGYTASTFSSSQKGKNKTKFHLTLPWFYKFIQDLLLLTS